MPPSMMRRPVRLACALAALLGVAALLPLACTSEPEPYDCADGVLYEGVCEGKCRPELCLHDEADAGGWRNTCVENRCQLVCAAHSECDNFAGKGGTPDDLSNTQSCTAAKEDDTSADVTICISNGKALGFGKKCPLGTECAAFSSCAGGEPCEGSCTDDPLDVCTRDAYACRGVADCKLGRCAQSQRPCRLEPACDDAACKPLECVTSGEGDANAYCTRFDCDDDADCPGGYRCGLRRDPHAVCGSSPQKGDNAFCGLTDEDCIDPAAPPAGGLYVEGPDCLLRRACLIRTECSSCETDLDCSRSEGLVCALQDDGTRGCGKRCEEDADCENGDYRCDTQQKACVHRFGACKGSGAFCEPCVDDVDCGPDASCVAGACLDVPFQIGCTTDDECPVAPNGKHGHCIDDPTSMANQTCTLPVSDSGISEYGCW
jgi:hypothetical protein